MIGRAGTGKTTTLNPVIQLHKEAGYSVIGMAIAASAADNLAKDTGSSSETIAFYVDKWKRYDEAKERLPHAKDALEGNTLLKTIKGLEKYQLTSNHLIIIDEAAMVGTLQWHTLIDKAKRSGAKVIAAGDDHQFKPIDAGDAARRIKDIAKGHGRTSELTSIIRQKQDWMREATLAFANLNTATALALYENHGHVVASSTREEAKEQIADDYIRRLVETPEQTGLVVAYTRDECTHINTAIRERLKERGLLSQEEGFALGQKNFAIGDKIVFLQNDRYQNQVKPLDKTSSFSVKNGSYGVIEKISPVTLMNDKEELVQTSRVTVHIDQTRVAFLLTNYAALDHGYAVTEHKSQGQTVDWTLVSASKYMDAYAVYVAMTRHRQDVELYYSQEEFKDFAALQRVLGQVNEKDLAIDYSISQENKEFWINVQDYKALGREMALFLKAQSLENKPSEEDWKAFTELKTERIQLASLMVEEWDLHKDFVRQAGLTKEAVEIAAGLKQRPLSHVEQKAQLTVEQYGAVSSQCRDLWLNLRKTHPGARAKLHPDYEAYQALKEERGSLANVMGPLRTGFRIEKRDKKIAYFQKVF